MPITKTTLGRQDESLVNARLYGAARTHTTIQLALDAIGSLHRTLLLTDEDDGIWTLGGNITIPANVILYVPTGCVIGGTGNLMINGGLIAYRWPVYTGSGTLTWNAGSKAFAANKVRTVQLDVTTILTENITATDTGWIGPTGAIGIPPDYPATDSDFTDFGLTVRNQTSVGGQKSNVGGADIYQFTTLTADTLSGSFHLGLRALTYLDLNGFHFIGSCRAARFAPGVYGSGGLLDNLDGIIVQAYPMESATVTTVTDITLRPPDATTTGTVTNFTAMLVDDVAATRVQSAIRGIRSQITTQGAEDRYNLFIDGTARNHIAGSVGIGAGTTTPPHQLYVIGRSTLGAPNSAPTDGDLANSQISFYLNQGANNLLIRVKYSDGTLKLATVALT